MDMQVDKLADEVTRVQLSGSLDIAGAQAVETRFASVVGANRRVVVDFSEVVFLASIGMRMLLAAAKQAQRRGGRFVLFNVRADVAKAIETAGLDALLPRCEDEAAAITATA